MVDLRIEADGRVLAPPQVTASMHPDVDGCVAGVFTDMVFPAPEGGGVVQVSYPFVFEPG